ncbi:hypothetical protein Tco_0499125 [Tanacetum coccineum]
MLEDFSSNAKGKLLEPALNLTVHCCGLEFRVLNSYDQNRRHFDVALSFVKTILATGFFVSSNFSSKHTLRFSTLHCYSASDFKSILC